MSKKRTSPEWVSELRKKQGKSDYSQEEERSLMAAYRGLHKGELQPLAESIKDGSLGVNPVLARVLVGMIEGDKNLSEFVLKVLPNQKVISRKSQSMTEEHKRYKRTNLIGSFMVEKGALEKGMVEAACTEATARFGLRRGAILGEWASFKKDCKKGMINQAWRAYLLEESSFENLLAFEAENPDFDYTVPEDFDPKLSSETIHGAIKKRAEIFSKLS